MAINVTRNRVNEFIAALTKAGGSSGNVSLRQTLKWNEDLYWKIQGHMIEAGQIVAGRGKGGSVRLTDAQVAASGIIEDKPLTIAITATLQYERERDLYPAIKKSVEDKWIKRFAFDDSLVEETHSRGSKDTGGTFTRPDITAVGIRRYVYLPKRLEVISFEIKPAEVVNIMGVLEAIAHREAAHRSYVIYAIARARFETSSEGDRIMELAQKYGVGVVLTENPSNVESWEILLDALRHEPDPSRLDRFLNDLPSDHIKKQLSKWKE